MIRSLVAALILIPLAVVIVLLALANRQAVTLSLDPLLSDKPGLAVTQPLFVLLLAAVLAGVIVGGIAAWLRQGKWRQAAKRAQAEARAARAEADGLRERLEAAERAAGQAPGAIAYRRPPAA
jgi:uncharacterized integral membrane protein